MITIIFILFYLLSIFLIHIIGLYFWKKRTDCGKTIGDMYEYYDAADGNTIYTLYFFLIVVQYI